MVYFKFVNFININIKIIVSDGIYICVLDDRFQNGEGMVGVCFIGDGLCRVCYEVCCSDKKFAFFYVI